MTLREYVGYLKHITSNLRLSVLIPLCLFLAVSTHTSDANAMVYRSSSIVSAFKKITPCPGTGKIEHRCPGYVVDHISPLCLDYPDAVYNMQYQDSVSAAVKDVYEKRACSLYRRGLYNRLNWHYP